MTKKEIELPVIPQFVADYVEGIKRDIDGNKISLKDQLNNAIGSFYSLSCPEKIKNWIHDVDNNSRFNLLIRAIVNGYDIEKVKKYVIKSPLYSYAQYVWKDADFGWLLWKSPDYASPAKFTMEEIENDPQLSQLKQFAVEVEDD